MSFPRLPCSVCDRDTAVRGGRYYRHDSKDGPRRGADGALLSCTGSYELAVIQHQLSLTFGEMDEDAGTLF